MQIAVGLGREAGMHGFSGIATALCNIFLNEGVDEIFTFDNFSHSGVPSLLLKYRLL
jgi:hypothetical protein